EADLIDGEEAVAVDVLGPGPGIVGGRAVGELDVGPLADPHRDVLRVPAGSIAGIDLEGEAAIDRVADLLEVVHHEVDPPAPAAREVMDPVLLDDEGPGA